MNTTLKTILLAVIAAVGALIYQGGLPTTVSAWQIIVIVIVLTILAEVVSLKLLSSISFLNTSFFGTVTPLDLINGLITSVVAALSVSLSAQYLSHETFSWISFFQTLETVALAYITAQFGIGPKSTTATVAK